MRGRIYFKGMPLLQCPCSRRWQQSYGVIELSGLKGDVNAREGMCCWGGYDRVGSGQWDITHYVYVRNSQEYIKKIVLKMCRQKTERWLNG